MRVLIFAALLLLPVPVVAADAQLTYQREANIIYYDAHGIGLLMDVYTPTGTSNGCGIVDVVSGAWHSDPGKLRDHERAQVFQVLCKQGFTIFAVRPGSVTKFGVLEMVDNIRRGIHWAKQNARKYKIDANRLGLMGASAGGHLACLTAMHATKLAGQTFDTSVAAVGAFFPPTDLLHYAGHDVDARAEFGFGVLVRRLAFPEGIEGLTEKQVNERVRQISPARLVHPNLPPFLLFHGTADLLVPMTQSLVMLEALKRENVPAELIIKEGGGHPWPTINEEVAVLGEWFTRQLHPAGEIVVKPTVRTIAIDGQFDDWQGVPSWTDPAGDTHDTNHSQKNDTPLAVDHPDADLLEYRVAHDDENLYVYFRSRGQIGRTQRGTDDKIAGRYYVIVTIDVDNNDDTGYWVHEGGYFPTSRGYDVNAEIEYFDGEFNTGNYLNHGALNSLELKQAFLDQSQFKYVAGNDGPYPAGFMRVLPGTYKQYTQWVYHDNGTVTFVRDKGPVVPGIVKSAISSDGHRLEAVFPFRGFLNDENGRPILAPGYKIDLSFSLEASGELAPGKQWASDTAEPINGYVLTPADKTP